MRWALTQSTSQFHTWNLDGNEKIELKYNKQAHSFRIAANEKRLFFIEKVGLLQSKFLVRTEYSVVNAEIFPSRNGHSGLIIFDGKKYTFERNEGSFHLSNKRENFSLTSEISEKEIFDEFELYSLLIATLRLSRKISTAKTEALFV